MSFDTAALAKNLITGTTPLSPSTRMELAAQTAAKMMYERIVLAIEGFEKGLDQDQEVGARLVSFGSDVTFHIETVGYWGPDMIIFQGVDPNNQKVQLLQHISQLSVLLVAVKKTQEEPRRIGFKLVETLKDKEDEE